MAQTATRKIIHLDMDCFYAAVETKYNPELRGKPVGVGGPPQSRSVLCTANYEARKFGVRSAMPSSMAVQLCPKLILVPPNFTLYKKESEAVREIMSRFTDKIEPLSLDEAYLDVTDSKEFHGSATLIAREIRRMIFEELKLTASAGIAPNKFLAKIASDWQKPNGQHVIRPEGVQDFVHPLPVGKIHGVGKVTEKKLVDLGLKTCGDIQAWPMEKLIEVFGNRGQDYFDMARGIDHRTVDTSSERKSVSVEETFSRDIKTREGCLQVLPSLYEDWSKRIERGGYKDRVRGALVKVKFFDFKGTTHETTLKHFPNLKNFEELFLKIWERRSDPIRLIGIGSRLQSEEDEEKIPYQLRLNFEAQLVL